MARKTGKGRSSWRYTVTGVVSVAAGVTLIGTGVVDTFHQAMGAAATSIVLGALLFLVANADRFEQFKAFGLEAKTRKLDEKIDEADKALDRLRRLNEISGTALLRIANMVGTRFGRLDAATQLRLLGDIQNLMREMGSDASVIETAIQPMALTFCVKISTAFHSEITNALAAESVRLGSAAETLGETPGNETQIAELKRAQDEITQYINSHGIQFHTFQIDEFPRVLLVIFDRFPTSLAASCAEAMSRFKDEAELIAADMRALNRGGPIANERLWLPRLEAYDDSRRGGVFP